MYLVGMFLFCVVTLSHQRLTKDGVKCECMKSIRCKYWVSAVSRGKYLDLPVCGYDHHTLAPLLCCPRDDVDWTSKANRTKREVQSLQGLGNIQLSCTVTSHNLASPAKIANQKCDEYGKLIFQSLYEVSVGGSPFQMKKSDTCAKNDEEDTDSAEAREFPHMALIGFRDEDNIDWQCAGSLISERFILSTAICASTGDDPAKWAKLGDLDISTDEDVARPQLYKINDRIIHPEYNKDLHKRDILRYYNDIALFKLDRDVTFTIYVRPACVFTRRDPPDNKADATGWGQRTKGESLSQILKKIKMDLLPIDDCNKAYNGMSNRTDLSQDRMICAKGVAVTGAHICQGDAGGPLQIPLKKPYCMYGIIGLTSFGSTCGQNLPSVFTRVTHYVPWIVENVWSE